MEHPFAILTWLLDKVGVHFFSNVLYSWLIMLFLIIVGKLAEAIREIKRRTTVVLVEQNFALASAVGDRYYILDDGHTVRHGAMRELVTDKEMQLRYLGIGAKNGAAARR